MFLVDKHKHAWVDENLLCFLLAYTMLFQAFPAVAVVPLKPELAKVKHVCILP